MTTERELDEGKRYRLDVLENERGRAEAHPKLAAVEPGGGEVVLALEVHHVRERTKSRDGVGVCQPPLARVGREPFGCRRGLQEAAAHLGKDQAMNVRHPEAEGAEWEEEARWEVRGYQCGRLVLDRRWTAAGVGGQ